MSSANAFNLDEAKILLSSKIENEKKLLCILDQVRLCVVSCLFHTMYVNKLFAE